MAEVVNEEKKTVAEEERSVIFETLRKIVLAGIGAIVIAQDEIEAFIEKMAERGEIAEKDARKLLKEVVERRKEDAKKAESEFDKRLDEALTRLNIPKKSDIDALSEKITALTKKVEELKKS